MRHTILLDLDPLNQTHKDEQAYRDDFDSFPDEDDWAQLAVFIESEYREHHVFNEALELRRKYPKYSDFAAQADAKGWEINHVMRLG